MCYTGWSIFMFCGFFEQFFFFSLKLSIPDKVWCDVFLKLICHIIMLNLSWPFFDWLDCVVRGGLLYFCLPFLFKHNAQLFSFDFPQKVLTAPPQRGILQQPPTCCVSVEVAVKRVGSGLYTSHRGQWGFLSCSSTVSSVSCPLHNIHTTLSR